MWRALELRLLFIPQSVYSGPRGAQLLSSMRRETTATTTLQTLHNYNSTVPRGIVSSAAIVSIETGDNSNNNSTDVTQLQFQRTPEYCEQRSYCQH
ncbi:hypothetical protein J6590_098205 [Homalodisca vitripennis]|nr:hypothetical protein J6590_098205 [Homalodisca vitripennis]